MSAGSSIGVLHFCRPVSASTAMVCVCAATYMVPSITSGWLDALAELSRLRFHTGTSCFTLAGVI